MDQAKDVKLLSVLQRLGRDLGDDAFVIEDHWKADLDAIGIARPDDRRYVVYISTFGPGTHPLAFECESPPSEESVVYASDGMTENASYESLLAAIRRHLL